MGVDQFAPTGVVIMKIGLLSLLLVLPLAAESNHDKLIQSSVDVLHEMSGSIPQNLIAKAQCVGIVPNQKRAGFIFGGHYGKGVLVCRTSSQPQGWSGPAVIQVEGGSFGLQIGGGETDVVFLVMNRSGQEKLMQDKFTIGGNAEAMAGPVGRSASAETDAQMHAEILGYSKSRGAFAGLTLNGSTIKPDHGENKSLYRRSVSQREILEGQVRAPAVADPLYAELNSNSVPSTGE
jgi:SH3 domain-containing YSC84-like protein 1